MDMWSLSFSDIPRIPETSHPPLESSTYWVKWIKNLIKYMEVYIQTLFICYQHLFFTCPSTAGSSSFESQKMERPSISVLSPSSPSGLRDAPQLLPGQLSVSIYWRKQGQFTMLCLGFLFISFVCICLAG